MKDLSYLCFHFQRRSHKYAKLNIENTMHLQEAKTNYYKTIYLQYAPILIRFAQKFVSPFLAEDIVHDVFLNRWHKQDFLLPENDLKRILYIAVRNACIDSLRRSALEQEVMNKRFTQLKLDELDFFEAADELFMRNDLLDVLMKKIDQLPERGQAIFRMAYMEGMKAAEIANQLNLSVRTVENQLYRSLTHLRRESNHLFLYLLLFFSLQETPTASSNAQQSRDESSKSKDEGFQSRDESSKSRDDGSKSRDDGSKSRDDGSKSRDDGSKSRDDGSKSRDDGSKSRDGGSKSRDDGSKSRDDGSKSRDESSKSRDEGSKSRDESSKSRDDGSKSRDDGSKSRDDGSKSRDETQSRDESSPFPEYLFQRM
jgi:RNA polymerase sigma-70 factor (ECF subfamily)